MQHIAFLFFLGCGIAYIWMGKDNFGRKEWVRFGLNIVFLVIGAIIIGFIFKGLLAVFPGLTKNTARHLMAAILGSLLFVFILKLIVVGVCSIFSNIMAFHDNYNTDDNRKMLEVNSAKIAPFLLNFVKLIVSMGAVIIYYGIWFGAAS